MSTLTLEAPATQSGRVTHEPFELRKEPNLDRAAATAMLGLNPTGGHIELTRELAKLLESSPEVAKGIADQIRGANVLQSINARRLSRIETLRESERAVEKNTGMFWKLAQSALGDTIPITQGAYLRQQIADSRQELKSTLALQNFTLKEIQRRVTHFLREHDPVTQELAPWKETIIKLQAQKLPETAADTLLCSMQDELQGQAKSKNGNLLMDLASISIKTVGSVTDKIQALAKSLDRTLIERAQTVIEICGNGEYTTPHRS